MSRRFRFTCSYDGSEFYGWQRQPDVPTVQETLEDTLSDTLDQPVTLHASGRTDRGVHALAQVVHLDVDLNATGLPVDRWRSLVNHRLPESVRIERLRFVPDGFDARGSARRRHYGYRFLRGPNGPFRSADYGWFLPGESWQPRRLADAARGLTGELPTRAISVRGGEPYRRDRWTITTRVRRRRANELWMVVRSPGFRYRMVRCLARAVVRLAEAKSIPEDVPSWLQQREGTFDPAPPGGCYLLGVDYPGEESTGFRNGLSRGPYGPN